MAPSFGISPALVTPFSPQGVDVRLLAHAQNCLDRGCRTATLFGTTGEGPSVSAKERDRVAAEMASAGIPAGRLVEAVLACSVEEAVFGTSRALGGRAGRPPGPALLFPAGAGRGGFAWYAEVFRAVGPDLRDVILYHIPGMTGVPLSHALVARLVDTFPGAVLGVKDSACDADATLALIAAFPASTSSWATRAISGGPARRARRARSAASPTWSRKP